VNNPTAEHIQGESDPSLPGRIRYITLPTKQIPLAIRWSFLLFAFSLPFQGTGFTFMSGSSLARISGLLFFAFYFFYYNPLSEKRSFPPVSGAMWWFGGYILIYALNGFLVAEEFYPEWFSGLITLIQLMVLFWCTSGVLDNETIARSFLFTYALAAFIFAAGMIVGIQTFSVTSVGSDRMTALGHDPNAVAKLMAMAAVILIGLYLNTSFKHVIGKILLILSVPVVLLAMVQTGSRGGTLAFMIGCLVYSLPFLKSRRKWTAIVLVALFTSVVLYFAVTSPAFFERLEAGYHGNLAGRDLIFPVSLEMILERPLFGWRPAELWYEIASRSGWRGLSDAHNLYLHLLLEVGLVGALPFFIGFCLCGIAAWKARSGRLGLIPAALLVTLLVANMSVTGLYNKELWLIFALGVATKCSLTRNRVAVHLKGAPRRVG
jgi:O-antigen ligase